MLFRIRRPEPQRSPLGGFGITEAEYDRIVARIRAERVTRPAPQIGGAATRLRFQLSEPTDFSAGHQQP